MSLIDGAIKVVYGVSVNLSGATLPPSTEPELQKLTPVTSPDYNAKGDKTRENETEAPPTPNDSSPADPISDQDNPDCKVSDSSVARTEPAPYPSEELQMTLLEAPPVEWLGLKVGPTFKQSMSVPLIGNLNDWENIIAARGRTCPIQLGDNKGRSLIITFNLSWRWNAWEPGLQTPDGKITTAPTLEMIKLSDQIMDELMDTVLNAESALEKVERLDSLNSLLGEKSAVSPEEILAAVKAHRAETEKQKKLDLNGAS